MSCCLKRVSYSSALRLPQESLTSLNQSTLCVELQAYSDVCEALSTVELTLGFLAMTGGHANMQLDDYLKDVLQMAEQTPPHVLKVTCTYSRKSVYVLTPEVQTLYLYSL